MANPFHYTSNYLLGEIMIKVEAVKTFSWAAAEGLTEEEASAFHTELGLALGKTLPVAELRSGLMSGNSLLVNTALQTLYTNMRYKPTAEDLTERVAAAGYQMSDLALIQKLVAKIEAGVDKEGVYLAAGLPVHKVDSLFSAFFDNTFAMVSRDVRMTLAKSLLDSGRYSSIDEIASKCGYANATSFRICYKNWYGDYPQLTRAKAVKQLFVFD